MTDDERCPCGLVPRYCPRHDPDTSAFVDADGKVWFPGGTDWGDNPSGTGVGADGRPTGMGGSSDSGHGSDSADDAGDNGLSPIGDMFGMGGMGV